MAKTIIYKFYGITIQMQYPLKYFILTIFLLLSFFSCTDSSDCFYVSNRKVRLTFVTANGKTIKDTTISKFSIVTSDSLPLYDTASGQQIGLPLSQVADTSTFYIAFDSIATDTLTFFYKRNLELISPECGFTTRFNLEHLKYSKNNITSVLFIDSYVDKDIEYGVNYKIVIRKRTDFKKK
ncbi:MAG TPA: DUF6452 family protein [Bacteroidales bacterium]|nr:DUF6452 family protein [Bacteroidales bacterium]